jgi:hypothetical protein
MTPTCYRGWPRTWTPSTGALTIPRIVSDKDGGILPSEGDAEPVAQVFVLRRVRARGNDARNERDVFELGEAHGWEEEAVAPNGPLPTEEHEVLPQVCDAAVCGRHLPWKELAAQDATRLVDQEEGRFGRGTERGILEEAEDSLPREDLGHAAVLGGVRGPFVMQPFSIPRIECNDAQHAAQTRNPLPHPLVDFVHGSQFRLARPGKGETAS